MYIYLPTLQFDLLSIDRLNGDPVEGPLKIMRLRPSPTGPTPGSHVRLEQVGVEVLHVDVGGLIE